jgi:hypothetical protein
MGWESAPILQASVMLAQGLKVRRDEWIGALALAAALKKDVLVRGFLAAPSVIQYKVAHEGRPKKDIVAGIQFVRNLANLDDRSARSSFFSASSICVRLSSINPLEMAIMANRTTSQLTF